MNGKFEDARDNLKVAAMVLGRSSEADAILSKNLNILPAQEEDRSQ
jgi:hypothetical protein